MDEYTELDSQQIKTEMQGQLDRLKWLMWASFVCVSFLIIEFLVGISLLIANASGNGFVMTSFEEEWRDFKQFIKLYFELN